MQKKQILNGGALLGAVLGANFLNFLFNALLGRWLSFENFGLISLVVTFYYVTSIFTNALSSTLNFSTSKLIGNGQSENATLIFTQIFKKSVIVSLAVILFWVVSIPLLMRFFQVSSPFPFLAFAPIILFSTIEYNITGFLQGRLKFFSTGLILITEPIIKILAGVFFAVSGFGAITYLSLPISVSIAAFTGLFILLASTQLPNKKITIHFDFPKKFFLNVMTVGIGSTIFFSIDLLLVRHFLPPMIAGQYALISVIGKMMFFFSTIFNIFTLTTVARTSDPQKMNLIFIKLVGATTLLTFTGWFFLGEIGDLIVPILLGQKSVQILGLLPMYTFGIALYSVSNVIVSFHLAKQEYVFSYCPILAGVFFSLLTVVRHEHLLDVTTNVTLACFLLLTTVLCLHIKYAQTEHQHAT